MAAELRTWPMSPAARGVVSAATSALRSRTRTGPAPRSARWKAVLRPQMPPPTMTVSASLLMPEGYPGVDQGAIALSASV